MAPAPAGFEIYTAAPDVWLQRPKLAGHVATISQMWALIEYELANIFVLLSGSNLAMGGVFSGIVPIQTRLNMIHKLINVFLEGNDQVAYQALRRDVETMAKRRNVIIHGFWTIRDEEPNTIFLQEKFPLTMAEAEPVPYTHEAFIDVQDQLERLRGDVTRFRKHIGELAREQPFPRSFLLK